MLLVIDIGNTNITFGLFSGEKLEKTFRFTSWAGSAEYEEVLLQQTEGFAIQKCIISSVKANLDNKFKKIIEKLYEIEAVSLYDIQDLGFKLDVEYPETVGADRIANTAAARKKYKLPVVVLDFGTATTIDVVDKNGNFIGGSIIPGLKLQLESLNSKTSKLPLISVSKTEIAIGKNTEDCILSGVILGHAYSMQGLVKKCSEELGVKPTVVLTGGYSKIMSEYLDFDFMNPNLTLEGLRFISESL